MINFGGLPEHPQFAQSRFVVLSVPFDGTASYVSGTRRGPRAIIEASTHMELWDEELNREPQESGIHTLRPLAKLPSDPEAMTERVFQAARPIVKAGKIPVTLGGEHTVSLGSIRACCERYPDLWVLQFDAHGDLRADFEDSAYSHACVMRRVHDLGIPFAQVGIRSICQEEAQFIRASLPEPFWMHALPEPRELARHLAVRMRGPLYITFDVDALDPGIMPATGTPEPGGLSYRGALEILKEVCGRFPVVGFDMVELSPIPGLVAPDFLAARLTYKMMAYSTATEKF